MSEGELDDLMLTLWTKNRPVALERVAELRAAVAAAAAGILGDDHREAARSAAHKLAGALGMYGFAEGSVLASRVEAHLTETPEGGDPVAMLGELDRLAEELAVER